MSDELEFRDEPDDTAPLHALEPWHILIVDDEPAVHEVTKLVLSDFTMDDRPLAFSHCYSAAQAHALLSQPNDIALILLDVVMESEHAGLDLVRTIRTDIGNRNVRIILRTGQPGQAPEEEVIRNFDINDYKEKTDLTRRKLVTVFYAGLRAYRDLTRLERATQGLRRSIEAIRQMYETHSLRRFASAVLDQVNHLLDMRGEGLCASRPTAYAAHSVQGQIKVLAATQAYSGLLVNEQISNLPSQVQTALRRALQEKVSHVGPQHYAGYCVTKSGSESVIYMEFAEPPHPAAHELLEIFSTNVAITYDGLLLLEESQEAQRASLLLWASAAEPHYEQPSLHATKVGRIAEHLAQAVGMRTREVELIRDAAILHDIGMTRVAPDIVQQTALLTDLQRQTMQSHTLAGHALLSQSACGVHTMGALIARDHHEHWDGSGYPLGTSSQGISQEGRIVAVADCLASMTQTRHYRAACTHQEALDFVVQQSGIRFEPALVDTLVSHWPAIEAILQS